MARLPKPCSIQDCDKRQHALGMCSGHYNRFLRHGDALGGSYARDHSYDSCQVDGCERVLYAKGMCHSHYAQRWRGQPVRSVATRVPLAGLTCTVDGCDRPQHSKDLCKRHYSLAWTRANPQNVAVAGYRRRARLLSRTLPYTQEQLISKLNYWGNRCWMCGTPASSVDHIKPISKGGYDCLANFRPACRSCNSRKKDRWSGVNHLSDFLRP